MGNRCKQCGGKGKAGNRYCIHCGALLEQTEQKAEILSMWDFLLILLLLAIPLVNIGVCIFWIVRNHENPNRRNFAKAWLIWALVGTILGGMFTVGVMRFLFWEYPVKQYYEYYEYYVPEEYGVPDVWINPQRV